MCLMQRTIGHPTKSKIFGALTRRRQHDAVEDYVQR